MRTPMTMVMLVAGLAVLFGLAVSLGQAFAPLLSGLPPGQFEGPEYGDGEDRRQGPRGLSIADAGFVLHPAGTRFSADTRSEFVFNIYTENRKLVTEYEEDHKEDMHLFVVRRDMTGYQHLYPTLEDGTWTVPLRLREAGSYRAFVTFRPKDVVRPVTLGVDLEVPGTVDLHAIPQPRPLAETGDYTVMIESDVVAGQPSRVFMNVLHDDEPVTDLQPHLGELGHLMLLREGDLGYLHTTPVPTTVSDQTISFDVNFPTPGFYRAFLEFQHQHEVHTVGFTVFAS